MSLFHLSALLVLHVCEQSDLVKVFIGQGSPPHEASRISGVGTKAHGVVAWGSDLIMLDSDNGVLVSLDTETGDVFDLWMVRCVATAATAATQKQAAAGAARNCATSYVAPKLTHLPYHSQLKAGRPQALLGTSTYSNTKLHVMTAGA